MKKLLFSSFLLFSASAYSAKSDYYETHTSGECRIHVYHCSFEDHDYLVFKNHSLIHDPACWCFIEPLPDNDDGNHSYLD